ncbi:hypothetical protein [Nocardiopsis ganjiahuensis]|uniref:hypothetical protein n=1 Tax=Nocardiopsis ganjiahuensis TaxID=239984 RepID=UPI0003494818
MHGDRSDPRDFWERGRASVPGSGLSASTPAASAQAPAAAPARQPAPAPVHPAAPSYVLPPEPPRPSGPPARVGGAVAALVVALCTLLIPILGVSLGLWFFVLVTNVPGIVLGILALVKIPDAVEVERYIRYTWACTFAYIALSVVFLVPVIALAVLFLLIGF